MDQFSLWYQWVRITCLKIFPSLCRLSCNLVKFCLFQLWIALSFDLLIWVTHVTDQRYAYINSRSRNIETWFCILLRSAHPSGTFSVYLNQDSLMTQLWVHLILMKLLEWHLTLSFTFRLWNMVLAIFHSQRSK